MFEFDEEINFQEIAPIKEQIISYGYSLLSSDHPKFWDYLICIEFKPEIGWLVKNMDKVWCVETNSWSQNNSSSIRGLGLYQAQAVARKLVPDVTHNGLSAWSLYNS